jgi:putative selenium metabolism hydrolase
MDTQAFQAWSNDRQTDCIEFLRDIISIPSASTVGEDEQAVAERVFKEFERLDYDKAFIDGCGNVHGYIEGKYPGAIMFNAHIDTVGVGDSDEWEYDPYGEIEDGVLYGRGASDMKSALASMVYSGACLKELDVTPRHGIYVSGVVQEESLGWAGTRYDIEDAIDEEIVAAIMGEATEMDVKIGNRGRIGIEIGLEGKSCHASAPERGINPLQHAGTIINHLEVLAEETGEHSFLGSGSLSVTNVRTETPSNAAIPDRARINVDRRLTLGEDEEKAHQEVKAALDVARDEYGDNVTATIDTVEVSRDSYTGHQFVIPKYSKPWLIDEDHPMVRSAHELASQVVADPGVRKWTFCTDGSYTMGTRDIPTIGFGPMEESYAHTQSDQVLVDDVIDAISVYALFGTELDTGTATV